MSSQTLTVAVPDNIYARIRDRARQANRTVEAEVVGVLAESVSSEDLLPPDLQSAVDALDLLDDASLRHAAESRLTDEQAADLESLHLKQRREGLTPAEDATRGDLIRSYERAMLVRAHAAALLHERDRSPIAQMD
jgi:plasmid stability protein